MFPVYIYMYIYREIPVKNTTTNYTVHSIILGILTFLITIFRNISVNAIPGSVFLLLIGTSIIFNMILSAVWLKKCFNYWHITAAVLCLSSAVVVGSISFITVDNRSNYSIGVPAAIAAAFFIGTMNVTQEYLQTFWDDFTFRAIEMTVYSSLIASVLTLMIGVSEISTWATVMTLISGNRDSLILIICISIALPVIKLIIRSSKYSTIQYSNAFFFEFVQSSSSLLGSLANIFIFGEPWGHGYIASIILMMISYAVYIHAKNVSKKATALAAQPKQDEISIDNPLEIQVSIIRGWK